MKSFFVLLFFNLISYSFQSFAQSGLVGHWEFEDTNNLTKATVGSDLQLTGSMHSVSGPDSPIGAINIGPGNYLTSTHGIAANGGGSQVNEYTVVMDIKIPDSSKWYALYQTYSSNGNDADWFINKDGKIGVGDVGYSSSVIKPYQWYRIAISVDNGSRYDYYVDGTKILSGSGQTIDGRFALGSKVLFFADNSGDDNSIAVADIKLYSKDLSDAEIASLGGYLHVFPYLQSPTSTSVYVCWSSSGTSNYTVEYGLTETLGSSKSATEETLSDSNIKWYTCKLDNLTPSTFYYYKVKTNSAESKIFKFRTEPVNTDSSEHIRIVILGDSRTYPAKFNEINDSLMSTVHSLYGGNIEANINLVFNVGDIVEDGREIEQFASEYFEPALSISSYIPHMVSIGNHERESSDFYAYMKYEDFGGSEGEKYYSFRIGKVQIIVLNTNTALRNDTQLNWLQNTLTTAQNDNSIDWILTFAHHPGKCEMWPDGNTDYVQSNIIPMLLQYSKVDMYIYGHTHDYERGTASDDGNLRLLLNGGGGAGLEGWGDYADTNPQEDLPEIQKSFNQHIYSILDIDIANKSYDLKTYSLGNSDKRIDNLLVDHFIRNKANQTPPSKPTFTFPTNNSCIQLPATIKTSGFNGNYGMMSSQLLISTESGNYANPVKTFSRDFENYYGETAAHDPIDKNAGIDLTEFSINDGELSLGTKYWCKVRYRDKNLQWSEWSDESSFTVTSELVINEILYDPASGSAGDANGDGTRSFSQDEFVEIINVSDSSVNISGYTLTDSVGSAVRHTFATNTILDTGESIVVFGGGFPSTSIPGQVVVASSGSLDLENTGDKIVLKDDSGNTIDLVRYNNGEIDQALARNPDTTGTFVNHTAISTNSVNYSPGIDNTDNTVFPETAVTGTLIINEFLADPASDDSGTTEVEGDANGDGTRDPAEDEFIEIVNRNGASIDVSGYTISDLKDKGTVRHKFASGTTIANNESIVIFGGGTPTGITGISFVASEGKLDLDNSGDRITIKDTSGNVVVCYAYGIEGGDNQSLAKNPDFTGSFVKHTTITGNPVSFSPNKKNSDNSDLPVELTKFTVKSIEENIVLNWETATEINNYGFEIEKNNGNGWKTIGFVEGHGNSNSPNKYSFVDKTVEVKVSYRLKQLDNNGNYEYSKVIEIESKLPEKYKLSQNYPNPFNPTTVISYTIPKASNVTLRVYNSLGQEVALLVNQKKISGNYQVKFNAEKLNSGIYLYKLQAGVFVDIKKMLLIK